MADETKDEGRDTPQLVGQSSDTDEPGTTSQVQATEPTFTKAQVDKMLSDAKAEAGREKARLAKEAEVSKQEAARLREDFQSTNSRLNALQDRIDQAELEKARDDPQLVKLYQARRELETEKRNVEVEKRRVAAEAAQVKTEREAMESQNRGAQIAARAAKHGVEVSELTELGITDMAVLEKVAGKMSKGKGKDTEKPVPAGKPEAINFRPDSGLSAGGMGEPTPEQLDKMSIEQYREWSSKRYK